MSVTEKAFAGVLEQFFEVAKNIEADLKASCPKDSGAAASAIHIKDVSEFKKLIGADINWGDYNDGGLHMYYANYGNGGPGRRIWPIRSRALNTKHGPKGMVHGYNGSHFIEKVASRYR